MTKVRFSQKISNMTPKKEGKNLFFLRSKEENENARSSLLNIETLQRMAAHDFNKIPR